MRNPAIVQALQGSEYDMFDKLSLRAPREDPQQTTKANSFRVPEVETTDVHSRSASVRMVEQHVYIYHIVRPPLYFVEYSIIVHHVTL